MAFEATETVPPFRTDVIKINLGNGRKSSRKSFVREREFAASDTLRDGKPEFFAGGDWLKVAPGMEEERDTSRT